MLLYFERILSEYTLNKDLWDLFISYTDELCKKKEDRLKIYEKATKNCPKDLEFWLGYFRELEKNESDGSIIGDAVLLSIQKAGDDIGYQFQYEVLKYFCEYYSRQFIVTPGQKPDLEGNSVVT